MRQEQIQEQIHGQTRGQIRGQIRGIKWQWALFIGITLALILLTHYELRAQAAGMATPPAEQAAQADQTDQQDRTFEETAKPKKIKKRKYHNWWDNYLDRN